MARTARAVAAHNDSISAELKQILRTLKLGKMLDALPERLALARTQELPYVDFLELLLADEVSRRDTNSAMLRARSAGLDPGMRLDTWDPSAAVAFDQQLWNELCSLRFVEAAQRGSAAGANRYPGFDLDAQVFALIVTLLRSARRVSAGWCWPRPRREIVPGKIVKTFRTGIVSQVS